MRIVAGFGNLLECLSTKFGRAADHVSFKLCRKFGQLPKPQKPPHPFDIPLHDY